MELKYLVGANIKKLRTKNKDTQANLAEKLSVQPVTVSGWENGHKEPSFDILEKIATIYKTPVSELFCDEQNKDVRCYAYNVSDLVRCVCASAASNMISDTIVRDNPTGDFIIEMTIARDAYGELRPDIKKKVQGALALVNSLKSGVLPMFVYNSAMAGLLENLNAPIPDDDDELPF